MDATERECGLEVRSLSNVGAAMEVSHELGCAFDGSGLSTKPCNQYLISESLRTYQQKLIEIPYKVGC